jgi:hypothetical protein
MYVYGGSNCKFQILNIPSELSYEIDLSIKEYEKLCKIIFILDYQLNFEHWENYKTSKNKDLNKIANNETYLIKTENSQTEEKTYIRRGNTKTDMSYFDDNLLNITKAHEKKNLTDNSLIFEENNKSIDHNISQNVSTLLNENKPLISKALINVKTAINKKGKPVVKNDKKKWDEDYD